MAKRGRPSKFDTINKEQLKILVLKGFTDNEVSDFFNINQATFNDWKQQHKDFYESLKEWKKEADIKVEKCLYQRAIGYAYDEIVYEKSKTGGLGIGISEGEIDSIKAENTYKTKITVKQVIPDVTAQIFWLKNRQPGQWRDRIETEHSGKIDGVGKLLIIRSDESVEDKTKTISG